MNKQIIQQNLDGCDDKWRGYTDKGEEKTAPFADWLAEEIEAQNILDRGEAATLKEAYTVFYHRMAEYLEKEGDNEAASLLLEYINNEGTDWNLDEKRLDYLVHLGYEFVHLEYAFEQQLVEQSEDYRNLKTRYSKQQGNVTIDKRSTVDKDKPKEGEIIMSREIIQQGLDGDDDKWCGYTDGGEKLTSCFADWLAQDIELHNLVESGEANNLDEAYDLFFRRMAKWETDKGYDEFAQLLLQHVDDKNVDCGDIDEDRLDFLRYLGYKFIPQKELSESKDKPKEVER